MSFLPKPTGLSNLTVPFPLKHSVQAPQKSGPLIKQEKIYPRYPFFERNNPTPPHSVMGLSWKISLVQLQVAPITGSNYSWRNPSPTGQQLSAT